MDAQQLVPEAEGSDTPVPSSNGTKEEVVALPMSSIKRESSERSLEESSDEEVQFRVEPGADDEPGRMIFNLIPNKQFGFTLLRFPPRVWLSAADNLFRGKDARKPFIDAFADEKVMGFTKYYLLMLEHSKYVCTTCKTVNFESCEMHVRSCVFWLLRIGTECMSLILV